LIGKIGKSGGEMNRFERLVAELDEALSLDMESSVLWWLRGEIRGCDEYFWGGEWEGIAGELCNEVRNRDGFLDDCGIWYSSLDDLERSERAFEAWLGSEGPGA
jgi:hypothetical protein